MSSSLDLVSGMIGKAERHHTRSDETRPPPEEPCTDQIQAAVADHGRYSWAILTSGGVATAGAANNPNYTGATSKSVSCVARYRKIAWSAPIPASDLGKSLLSSQFYRAWNSQGGVGQDHIDIAKAPDGSLSMRVQFTPVYGYYGFKGKTFAAKPLQTACFSFRMWIANNYWTGYQTNFHGHKMPRLWGGPIWYRPACSRRSEALATGSGFTAALWMRNNRTIGFAELRLFRFESYGLRQGPESWCCTDARHGPLAPVRP